MHSAIQHSVTLVSSVSMDHGDTVEEAVVVFVAGYVTPALMLVTQSASFWVFTVH